MARKKKLSKEAEQSLYFETMANAGVAAPDGMSSKGDGKDKNLARELEMRIDFEANQGPCVRCTAEIGHIGHITADGIVCALCAEDIKKKRDTRGAWWRRK